MVFCQTRKVVIGQLQMSPTFWLHEKVIWKSSSIVTGRLYTGAGALMLWLAMTDIRGVMKQTEKVKVTSGYSQIYWKTLTAILMASVPWSKCYGPVCSIAVMLGHIVWRSYHLPWDAIMSSAVVGRMGSITTHTHFWVTVPIVRPTYWRGTVTCITDGRSIYD